MRWIYIAVLLSIGLVSGYNEIPEDIQDIENKLGDLSDLVDQKAVPSVEEVQDVVRKKCEKNGKPDSFENLKTAKDAFQECIESNFNFTQIQEELDKSRKTGSMDEVFAKYCLKRPVIQDCVEKLTLTIEECLEEEEKSSLKLFRNITDSLVTFACYKDGDRIAMFVAEGGFECIQSKREGLEQCANKTLGHHIPANLSLTNLPSLVVTKEGCNEYANLQSCVVNVLEGCQDNTPANIVDALFRYIRRITPCKDHNVASVVGAPYRVPRSFSNQQEADSLVKIFEQVKKNYERHCLKNGGQIAADKFYEALDQVKNCSNLTHSALTQKAAEVKGVPFEYFCHDFRFGIRGCLSILTEKLAACSSPQEAYIPKFGIELSDSIFHFYCKDNARALKKFLGEKDACLKRVHNSTGFCLSKTKHIKLYAKDDVVTKSELCVDLKMLRNCFLDVAAQHCPNNANTNEFLVGLSDAMYAPCAVCKVVVTNSLLLLILLIRLF